MTRKIFIVRKPHIRTGVSESWLSNSAESIRNVDSFIDVRYVHKETDKCLYISVCEDPNDRMAYTHRQLKTAINYFDTEEAALQELQNIYYQLYNEMSAYRDALARGVRTLMRKLDAK